MERSINEQLIEKMEAGLSGIKKSEKLNNVSHDELARIEASIFGIVMALDDPYGYIEYGKRF